MKLTVIEGSSQIAAMGHLPETNELIVKFHAGGIYRYQGIDADLYERFFIAESKGRTFNNEVRNKYTYLKISQEELEVL